MRGRVGDANMQQVNLIHILLVFVVVAVVGVTMAVTGFSRDTFMGLVCVAAAVGLVAPNVKNIQNPPPGYSRGSYVFMFVLAALLAAGGLYVLIFGIPQ